MHITRALLRAVVDGKLPVADLVRAVEAHLTDLCPTCQAEISAFRQQRLRQMGYEQVVSKVLSSVQERERAVAKEREHAKEWRRQLLALPAEKRVPAVLRARSRYRGLAFAEAMLEAARRSLPADPQGALACAEVAELAAAPVAKQFPEWTARALAHQANAHRAAGSLAEAEALFVRARTAMEMAPDPSANAEIDSLEGSLATDQRRFAAARQLLTRGARRYQLLEDPLSQARCLIKLGSCSYHAGAIAEAVEVTRRALSLVDPDARPHLFLCARHNLTVFLCADGRFAEARDVLAYDLDLYRSHPDAWTQLRLAWLQGKIAHGLGHLAEAEDYFQTARSGFTEEGIGYDVALVSLDLALVLAEQGRHRELAALAKDTVTIFAAHALHREALAALILFRRAAVAHQATCRTIRHLIAYLEQARTDPTYRYQSSS